MTRTCLLVLTGALLVSAPALRPAEAQLRGYGVAGPAGAASSWISARKTVHVAGGAEFQLAGPVRVSAEFGFFDYIGVSSVTGRLGRGSLGGSRFSPFAVGGYSRFGILNDRSFNTWVIGVGADIRRVGRHDLRVELRDHVRPDFRGTVHYWSVRVGFVSRTSTP